MGFQPAAASPTPAAQPLDSVAVRAGARAAQARFERERVYHIPLSLTPPGAGCDEQVGRFCLRHPGDRVDESRPPIRLAPEPAQVAAARAEFIAALTTALTEVPGDAWIVGQLVQANGEAEDWEKALQVARACQSPEPGWCLALQGLALHRLHRIDEAMSAFERAIEAFDPEARTRWRALGPLLTGPLARAIRQRTGQDPARTEALEAWIWAVSDPLFLIPGNAFLTEHWARHTAIRIREDAVNPYGLRWGSDLAELMLRFGPVAAWERTLESALQLGPAPVLGRHDPLARWLLPSTGAVADPASSRDDAFPTDRRDLQSRHRAPGVDHLRGLEGSITRFLRGDSLLLVAGWRVPPVPVWDSVPPPSAAPEVGIFFLPGLGDLAPAGDLASAGDLAPARDLASAGLLLIQGTAQPRRAHSEAEQIRGPAHSDAEQRGSRAHSEAEQIRSGAPSGAAYLTAPASDGVVSVEVLDREGRRAWRLRTVVSSLDPTRAGVQMSDLLLLTPETEPLAPGAPHIASPGSQPSAPAAPGMPSPNDPLLAHLQRVIPGDTLNRAPVEVLWEMYGVTAADPILPFQVRVGRVDRGVLRRVGEALRLTQPVSPVEIRWEEGVEMGDGPEAQLLRRVVLDLSALEPGSYDLHVSLRLPGRGEIAAVRSVVIR